MTQTSPQADGQIHLMALDAIDADAIPRNRTATDPAAFEALVLSIARGGLRMPIELFRLAADSGAPAYGLISGHRRLSAFRHLNELRAGADFAAIPALLRNPYDLRPCPHRHGRRKRDPRQPHAMKTRRHCRHPQPPLQCLRRMPNSQATVEIAPQRMPKLTTWDLMKRERATCRAVMAAGADR